MNYIFKVAKAAHDQTRAHISIIGTISSGNVHHRVSKTSAISSGNVHHRVSKTGVFSSGNVHHRVSKAGKGAGDLLARLDAFLDAETPQAMLWLVTEWKGQQAAVSYDDLREAALSGELPGSLLDEWQRRYAELVNAKLAPQWMKAMDSAAESRKRMFPDFLYDPAAGLSRQYIQEQGAELITNIMSSQREAIRAIVGQAAHSEGMTADSLAEMIRPAIGLTKPQAAANLNYYNGRLAAIKEAHPRMSQASAEKKALEAAARYAAKQHRYRASSIAATELAMAYSHGADAATRDAQAQGYLGECRKVWVTAADELVCPACGAVDGEAVSMDATFNNGADLPPAHPNCRCAVAYEEMALSDLQLSTNDRIESISETNIIDNLTYDDIINDMGIEISSSIESPHPSEIEFGTKKLSNRQKKILDSLPKCNSQIIIRKRSISLLDLAALTAYTGNEFAMFTLKGERLIVRGDEKRLILSPEQSNAIRCKGYRWSGHTHVGRGDSILTPSEGDYNTLTYFQQQKSVVYNSTGRYNIFSLER